MFNGIIHKTARVLAVEENPFGRRIILHAPWTDHQHGESTAINGTCLTVAAILDNPASPTGKALAYDVIRESLDKTNLGAFKVGDEVHMERSLRVGDPIDGHFVQGHVDGTGPLLHQVSTPEEVRLRIQAPAALVKYLIPKGSIAIDGVSLTLAAIDGSTFEVALIPTTLQLTTLGRHPIGYRFNLECDSMSKTIISYLEKIQPRGED